MPRRELNPTGVAALSNRLLLYIADRAAAARQERDGLPITHTEIERLLGVSKQEDMGKYYAIIQQTRHLIEKDATNKVVLVTPTSKMFENVMMGTGYYIMDKATHYKRAMDRRTKLANGCINNNARLMANIDVEGMTRNQVQSYRITNQSLTQLAQSLSVFKEAL